MDEQNQQAPFFSPRMIATITTASSTAVGAYAGYRFSGKDPLFALMGAAVGFFALDPLVFMLLFPGGKSRF